MIVKKKIHSIIINYLFLIILGVIFIFPIFWMLLISVKQPIDIIRIPPKFLVKPNWENYKLIMKNSQVIKGFLNSIILTFCTLVISFSIGIPAAYAIARYNFRFKRIFLMGILSGLMIPLISLALPYYVIFQAIGLMDTLVGLILVYLVIHIPFIVWMMGSFISQIPKELDESAFIDGCNTLTILLKIIIPTAKPGLAAAAISCVIATWNEFLFAFILTQTKTKTAPVVIVSFMSTTGIEWGKMASMATILVLPIVIFGLSVQKYYIVGLTAGAIKG
jgi:ABC-type glycerol-3-phosphate transport system permease component